MKVLLTENEIAARIAQLGGEITEAYRGKELTVIVMMNGAVIFAADLLRKIDLPLYVDCFSASSYENDRSTGKITLISGRSSDAMVTASKAGRSRLTTRLTC